MSKSETKPKATKTKKENPMKKAVITTVLITLATVGLLGSMFYLGIKYEQGVNARVHSEVKALTASIQTTPSKQ